VLLFAVFALMAAVFAAVFTIALPRRGSRR
jgi:hypothetical protein